MKCEECKEMLWSYAKKELNAQEMKQVELHLQTCKDCQQELNEIEEIAGALMSFPEVELPDGFHNALMAKLEQETKVIALPVKNKARNNWKQLSLVAAAVLAVVVIGQMKDELDYSRMQRELIHSAEELQELPVVSTTQKSDSQLNVAEIAGNGAQSTQNAGDRNLVGDGIAAVPEAESGVAVDAPATMIASEDPAVQEFAQGETKGRMIFENPQEVTLQVTDDAVARGEIIDYLSKVDGSEVNIVNDNLEISIPATALDKLLDEIANHGKIIQNNKVEVDGDMVQVVVSFEVV